MPPKTPNELPGERKIERITSHKLYKLSYNNLKIPINRKGFIGLHKNRWNLDSLLRTISKLRPNFLKIDPRFSSPILLTKKFFLWAFESGEWKFASIIELIQCLLQISSEKLKEILEIENSFQLYRFIKTLKYRLETLDSSVNTYPTLNGLVLAFTSINLVSLNKEKFNKFNEILATAQLPFEIEIEIGYNDTAVKFIKDFLANKNNNLNRPDLKLFNKFIHNFSLIVQNPSMSIAFELIEELIKNSSEEDYLINLDWLKDKRKEFYYNILKIFHLFSGDDIEKQNELYFQIKSGLKEKVFPLINNEKEEYHQIFGIFLRTIEKLIISDEDALKQLGNLWSIFSKIHKIYLEKKSSPEPNIIDQFSSIINSSLEVFSKHKILNLDLLEFILDHIPSRDTYKIEHLASFVDCSTHFINMSKADMVNFIKELFLNAPNQPNYFYHDERDSLANLIYKGIELREKWRTAHYSDASLTDYGPCHPYRFFKEESRKIIENIHIIASDTQAKEKNSY